MRVAIFFEFEWFWVQFQWGFPGRITGWKTVFFWWNFQWSSLRLQAENTPELIQAFQTFFTQVGLKPYHGDPLKICRWKSRNMSWNATSGKMLGMIDASMWGKTRGRSLGAEESQSTQRGGEKHGKNEKTADRTNLPIWQQVHLENMKLHKKQFVSLVSDISENLRENGFKISDAFVRDCEWRLVDHFEDQNNVECRISPCLFLVGKLWKTRIFPTNFGSLADFLSKFPFCRKYGSNKLSQASTNEWQCQILSDSEHGNA